MLTKLSLTRFQGFAHKTEVPLRPLTLIFGPNASGKSSIIRSMLLARQSLGSNSRFNVGRIGFEYEGEDISLASFANVVYKHDEKSSYKIEITVNQISELMNSSTRMALRESKNRSGLIDLEGLVEELVTEWEVSKDKAVKSTVVTIKFKNFAEPFKMEFKTKKQSFEDQKIVLDYEVGISDLDVILRLIESAIKKSKDLNEEQLMQWIFKDGPSGPMGKGTLQNTYEEKLKNEIDDIQGILENLSFGLANGNFIRMKAQGPNGSIIGANIAQILEFQQAVVNRTMRSIRHIGPLREISKRLTYEAGSIEAVEDDSQVIEIEPLENEVSNWLLELTEGRYRLSPVESYLGKVRWLGAIKSQILTDNRTGTPVTFQDVGVGLSQILPILETISKASASRGHTVLIEQPELHLHPKMQANLVDLFISHVSQAPASRSIIAETHSEPMLLRIQKRIRDGSLDPSLVQIIYVDQSPQSPDNANSEGNFAFPLPLDEQGDFLMPMPNSFSSLRFEDLI